MSNPNSYTHRNLELRAAEYYANIRKPKNEWKSIEDLAPQLAEFEYLVRSGGHDRACRVLDMIDYEHLYRWGYYARLMKMRKTILGKLAKSDLKANTLNSLGRTYHTQGKVMQAIRFYEEALILARENGDRFREGRELGRLGGAYRDLGQLENAIELHSQALIIARELQDRSQELSQLVRLGIDHYVLDYVDQAIGFWREGLKIARDIGHQQREGACLASLGSAYRKTGQIKYALQLYKKALTIANEEGDHREETTIFSSIGTTHYALGKYVQALEFHKQGLTIARNIEHRYWQGIHLSRLGDTYLALKNFEYAFKNYEKAKAIFTESNKRQKSYALLGLGKLSLAQGNILKSEQYFSTVMAMKVSTTRYQAALGLGIVRLFLDQSNAKEAFSLTKKYCKSILNRTISLYEIYYILATAIIGQAVCDPNWADPTQRNDLLAPALAEYRRALDITSAPGVVRDAIRDLELIRAAGIEGLEPVFELLEGALDEQP